MDTRQSTTNSELLGLKIIHVQIAGRLMMMRNSIHIYIYRSVI